MGLSILDIKDIIKPKIHSAPADDFRLLDSWAEFDTDPKKSIDDRPLEYLCYKIQVMNPETGEKTIAFKALKFCRVIRLPKSAKQSKSFMQMHEQVLASVWENNINLVTVIANVLQPVPLGLMFLYGVQGVADNIADAKKIAHADYIGFLSVMQGTYKVMEMSVLKQEETEWLRQKMFGMEYITVVRGIPKANNGGVDISKKTLNNEEVNPDGSGTIEEIVLGMADYEYVIQILSTPVYRSTLEAWSLKNEQDMTDWYEQMQGTKSLSFNLSIPMMYMANSSTSNGWSEAYTDASSVSHGTSESFSAGFGESVGASLSQTYGQSLGTSVGNSFSQSISNSQSYTFGETVGETLGQSIGNSFGQTVSEGYSQTVTEGISHNISEGYSQTYTEGISHNISETLGQTTSHTVGETLGDTFGHSTGTSDGLTNGVTNGNTISQNLGQTYGNSTGSSTGASYGTGTSFNQGTSIGESYNTSEGYSTGISQGVSTSETVGSNVSNSTSVGLTQGESISSSQSQSISNSSGSSYSQSLNNSSSVTNSVSSGISQNYSLGNNYSQTSGVNSSTSLSNSLSENYGQSANTSQSWNSGMSNSFGTSDTYTDSVSLTNSTAESEGISAGGGASLFGISGNASTNSSSSESTGTSISTSSGTGLSQNLGYTYSNGASQSTGESWGASQGITSGYSTGQSASVSSGLSTSESYGYNASSSQGVSNGVSYGQSLGTTQSVSNTNGVSTGWGESMSLSQTSGTSYGQSQSESVSQNYGTSASANTSVSQGTSESVNVSNGVSSNTSISSSTNDSTSNSVSQTLGLSDSLSNSTSTSQSVNDSYSNSSSQSTSDSYSDSSSYSLGNSYGTSVSNSYGTSVSNSYGESLSNSYGNSVTNSYSNTTSATDSYSQSASQSQSVSQGITEGQSIGENISQSSTQSVSQGTSESTNSSKSVSESTGTNDSTSRSLGQSLGSTGAYATSSGGSMGLGPSIGYSKSYQWLDQQVKDILEILEYQNERIKYALKGNGAFYTYVYIACPSADALSAAKALAKSTWQNEYALTSPLQVLDLDSEEQRHLLYHFSAFSSDVTRENVAGVSEYKYATVLLPNEFVAYTHPPRISEGGIYAEVEDIPKFAVPSLMKGEIYMGTVLSSERYTMENGYKTPFDYRIAEETLMHGYFTGQSRSGKTEAAMRFTAELTKVRRKDTGKRLRIVAMDPKNDWRRLARFVEPERFKFYSLGNVNFHPIKLNPFKIPYGVWPQTWIDGLIDIYCRAYGLLERGKQMMGETIYYLYEQAGVFKVLDRDDWKELVPDLSSQVTFKKVYSHMLSIKVSLEDPKNPKGRAGNDTRDAYARLLDRLQAFNREFSIESQLFSSEDGMGVDELIGDDDITVLESSGLESTFSNFIFGIIASGFYKYAKSREEGYKASDQYETVLIIEEANKVLTGSDTCGTGGGAQFGITGQSEFEEMLDQAAGLGLFIIAITQKIADMPSSIIANAGLIFAGRLTRADDISVVMKSIGREERIEDRDVMKWFARSPTGWFVCRTGRTFDYKESEPILVQIARLNFSNPSNNELDEILAQKRAKTVLAGSTA